MKYQQNSSPHFQVKDGVGIMNLFDIIFFGWYHIMAQTIYALRSEKGAIGPKEHSFFITFFVHGINLWSLISYLAAKSWHITAPLYLNLRLNQGDAAYYLGLIYEKNNNYAQALSKFEEAFEKGNNKALHQISMIYEFAGKRDELAALLKEHAKKMNTTAMILLGELYDVESPPEDATPFSSYYWYKKAADAGDVQGMHKLAYSYKLGKCSIGYTMQCDPMYDSAIYWYNRAGFSW